MLRGDLVELFRKSNYDDPTDLLDPSGLKPPANPFECAANAASKVSLASSLKALGAGKIPGGSFVADALGGNVFSGATDLVTSIATGQSGEGADTHSVFYSMGQSVVAKPTQGFGWGVQRLQAVSAPPWRTHHGDQAYPTWPRIPF